jgi:membrane-associated phospholipid phosphatase
MAGITFQYNVVLDLVIALLISGLVMTARLYLKAHTFMEVIMGYFAGILIMGMVFLQ